MDLIPPVRPMKLAAKLADLGVPTPTCNWILDFLTDRSQVVRMEKNVKYANTTILGLIGGSDETTTSYFWTLGDEPYAAATHHQGDCGGANREPELPWPSCESLSLGKETTVKRTQRRLNFTRMLKDIKESPQITAHYTK